MAVLFLVGLSVIFDVAEVADINFIIGCGIAEDQFDSLYLDEDGGAVFLKIICSEPERKEQERDYYRLEMDATAARYGASELNFHDIQGVRTPRGSI